MRRFAYKLGLRLAQIRFIRSALDDHAGLQDARPGMIIRCITGLLLIAVSNICCWPLIAVLAGMAIHQKKPLIAAIGGPLVWGITFGLNAAGLALAGGKFARMFLRWRARVWVELLLSLGRAEDGNSNEETSKPSNE